MNELRRCIETFNPDITYGNIYRIREFKGNKVSFFGVQPTKSRKYFTYSELIKHFELVSGPIPGDFILYKGKTEGSDSYIRQNRVYKISEMGELEGNVRIIDESDDLIELYSNEFVIVSITDIEEPDSDD